MFCPDVTCRHWETFAGVDWKILNQLTLSANFVNLLFQNGAKGSIDVADTITDASLLENYETDLSFLTIRSLSKQLLH